MAKTKKTQPSPELSRRVATYSALATAAMLASPAAEAALQVWDVNRTLSWTPFSVVATSINPLFEIGFLIQESSYHSGTSTNFIGPNGNLSFINESGGGNDPERLPAGFAVGSIVPAPGGTWYLAEISSTSNDIDGPWMPGDQGFIGIRFPNGGDYNYGWVDVTMDNGGAVTVNRWALDDVPGTPALTGAGAVPEPGTGALLALLAMGATGLRRRRQSAAV